MKCKLCGDTLKTRKIKKRMWCGIDKGHQVVTVGTEEYCPYCEWKGNTGMGAILRQQIKQINEGNKICQVNT